MGLNEPWSQLASGARVWLDRGLIDGPFDLVDDVFIPLGRVPRFAGQTRRTWTVAHHSVVVARLVKLQGASRAVQRMGLLHDAHEAVTGDIPTPVKRAIGVSAVTQVQERVQGAILDRLGLRPEAGMSSDVIKRADLLALHAEARVFMQGAEGWGLPPMSASEVVAAMPIVEGVALNAATGSQAMEACWTQLTT